MLGPQCKSVALAILNYIAIPGVLTQEKRNDGKFLDHLALEVFVSVFHCIGLRTEVDRVSDAFYSDWFIESH